MIAPGGAVVLIPAWNEERTVAAVVGEVRAAVPDADVVVIDDGSGDGTAAAAREAGATVIPLPFNLGVGGAMRAGYRYALERGYDAAVQVDADGQHDPTAIPALLAALDDADVVIGARFAGAGEYRATGPRRLAMRFLARRLSKVAKTRLTDVTSGFRAVNRPTIELYAHDYPVEYLGDTVEALVTAARAGCRITQVPVAMRARAGGRASHSPLRAAVYLVRAGLVLLIALVKKPPAKVVRPPVPGGGAS